MTCPLILENERPGSISVPTRRVLLANPRGFCAGVRRAINAVEDALQLSGAPVYVRRAIVHNREVVNRLEKLGAVFVQEVEEIPEGAVAILSAHGSARSVKAAAQKRNLQVIDAVCPLVAKVHTEVDNWHRLGRHTLLIGHRDHPEIIGTLGQVPAGAITVISTQEDLQLLNIPRDAPIAYAVQTTFSMRDAEGLISAIKARFDNVAGPRTSDICYATTNRQQAVEAIARQADVVLVVGDAASSNAQRLVEVAKNAGCPNAYLIAGAADLPALALENVSTIGLTAAASTPDSLVASVCEALALHQFELTEVSGSHEPVSFKPVPLDAIAPARNAYPLDTLMHQLRKDIDATLERAIAQAETPHHRLADAMHYAVVGGGKRFRALLVAAVAELVGGAYPQALRIGAAIECVHAQSLVHDDLPCMDDDTFRRGRLTLHRKYDEATAVLAGDALLALAFEILADEATHPSGELRARLVLSLARALGQDGLAGGQMMDMYPPANPTADDVFACHSRKTGALIRYAVEAGALLGASSDAEKEHLRRYADSLGLLFQIRDDLLDELGDAAIVGKALSKDAASGRKSATTLLGVTGAAQQAQRLEAACHDALASFGPRASALRELARYAARRRK